MLVTLADTTGRALNVAAAIVDRCVAEPDETAVAAIERRVSRRELDAESGALAGRLTDVGVARGTYVGVALPRDTRAVVALLALLRAGGIYVPLPDGPAHRIRQLGGDRLTAVITTSDHVASGAWAGEGPTIILVDATAHYDCDPATAAAVTEVAAGDPMCLLHTSGSTGTPKGVLLSHGGIQDMLGYSAEIFPAADRHGTLASTTFSFDMSLLELLLPLAAGGTVVLVDKLVTLAEPERVPDHEISLICTVPSMLREFLRLAPLPVSVGTVVVAGEVLQREVVAAIAARSSARRLVNLYGPAETTVYKTCWVSDPATDMTPTIGSLVPGALAAVVDDEGAAVPTGEVGELWLAGPGTGLGYVDDPAHTDGRFFHDPTLGWTYRTGDLVRDTGTGDFVFVGRRDDQVKIRGIRVEPAEVEAMLSAIDGINEVAVAGREDATGAQLVAWLVLAHGVLLKDARRAARAVLPPHLTPDLFLSVDDLPRTSSGKIDRRALAVSPDPHTTDGYGDERHPESVEDRVLTLWRQLLQADGLGLDDDFFDFGGHSLLAVRMLADVQEQLHLDAPVRVLTSRPLTVRTFAAGLRPRTGSRDALRIEMVQPRGTRPCLYIAFAEDSSALTVRHLVTALGWDQPLAVILPGTGGWTRDATSVDELGRLLADRLAELQPEGDFALAGHSFGGLLAHAAAECLADDGHRVASVLLLDTVFGSTVSPFFAPRARIGRVMQRPPRSWPGYLARAAWRRRPTRAPRHTSRPMRLAEGEFDWNGIGRLTADFDARPLSTPVHLLVTDTSRKDFSGSDTLGWRAVYGERLHVHDVGGDHFSMLSLPHVDGLAAAMTAILSPRGPPAAPRSSWSRRPAGRMSASRSRVPRQCGPALAPASPWVGSTCSEGNKV